MSTPTPDQSPPPATSPARRGRSHLAWFALWLPGAALALLLAGGLALWLWASTSGSLATAIGWAEQWMQGRSGTVGRLTTQGVEGSLRGGGRIASLTWSQGELKVEAQGVKLDWSDALWLGALQGQGVQLDSLAIKKLSVDDQRAPQPTEPITALELPLPVGLAFSVDQFALSGNSALSLSDLKGDYQYNAISSPFEGPALPDTPGLTHAHRLRLDSVQLADGRYQGLASLGAQAPMPLALALQGHVQTRVPNGEVVELTALGQAKGTLSGPQASIDIDLEAEGQPQSPKASTSTLTLQARVMPWAKQPVVSAKAQAQSLNLAALWPSAPVTDLSGQLQAQPEGDAWRAQLQLTNAQVAPADKGGLPLRSLQTDITQQGDRWTIAQLKAEIGGGQLQGQGSMRLITQSPSTAIGAWQGALKASGVQPALLWSELAPGALDGTLSAQAEPSAASPNAVVLQANIAPSAQQPRGTSVTGLRLNGLRLQGQWLPSTQGASTAGLLKLNQAHLDMAGAQLDAQGQFDTQGMSYEGAVQLRLPGASLDTSGLLAHAKGQGKANLQLQDASRVLTWVRSLQDLPFVGPALRNALAGQEALAISGKADANIQWTGGLGALGFPAPAQVTNTSATADSGANSSATVSAATVAPPWPQIRGALNVPRLSLRQGADATDTVVEGIAIEANGPFSNMEMNAKGSVALASWRATLDTAGVLRANTPLHSGGSLNLNRLSLQLLPKVKEGDKSTASGWALKSAQPLQLGWQTTPGRGFVLDAGAGELQLRPVASNAPARASPLLFAWQSAAWQQGQSLETQGRVQGLTLPWIEALAAFGQTASAMGPLEKSGVSGDLVFDGAWNIRIPADPLSPLDVSATLQRRSGDVRWANGAGASASAAPAAADRIAAGVKDARISLVVKDREAQALLRWDSDRLGQVTADLSAPLTNGKADATSLLDRWMPANTPLRGTATARLPQVGVWSMFTPPGWRMSGTLAADATLSGTRDQPEWRGSLQADELSLRSVVDGFAFSNGQLRATIAGERISVDRFTLQGPGGAQTGGTLEASGLAEWRATPGSLVRQPFITLKANAQKLRVSNRVDRRVTLSGDVTAQLDGPKLQLRGQLKTDAAQIILPDELAPSLGKDVVVRSTSSLPVEEEGNQRVQPDVSVSLDLGDQFEVRGQGIQTRLEGQLTVRATPTLPTPRALGEVRTVKGTYKAYGQQLNIETGVLRFTGPYDDPALDILAVRKLPENTDQRVGVTITGNAQAPRVGLYSDPPLTNGDTLAWLVLGRPASAAGAQAFVLQQAARQLLSRGGEPLDGALAKSLGLDEIGFASASTNADGTATEAALTVGKRLSNDIYLSYEQSLAGTMSAVSILYDLSKSLTLRARAGTENAIDLIFTHRYE